MQRGLLAESDLTCKKAVELAKPIESAEHNVRDLQKSSSRDLHTIMPVECLRTPHRSSPEIIKVLGSINVIASKGNQSRQLSLLAVPTNGPTIFGQDWLRAINLDWKQLRHLQVVLQQALQNILGKYSNLFNSKMGTFKSTTVTIHIQPNAHPCFFLPRPVLYTLGNKVEVELQHLQNAGVVEPTQFLTGRFQLSWFSRRMVLYESVWISRSPSTR